MSSSKLKLSERILKSGDPINERIDKMPYFTEHFTKDTVDEEAKQFGKRMARDGLLYFKFLKPILEMGVKKTDSSEEKAIFETMISGIDQMYDDFKQQCELVLGEFEDKYISKPMTRTLYSLKQNYLAVTSSGTFLHFLVVILPVFYAVINDNKRLKSNPNLKSSPFLDFFIYENVGFNTMFGIICSMIDKRDDISESEESILKEIFKRSLIYEIMIKDSEFTGREWSGGLLYQ